MFTAENSMLLILDKAWLQLNLLDQPHSRFHLEA